MLLGGEASYEAYARLISPMINDLHGGFNTSTMVQPAVDANFKLLQVGKAYMCESVVV